MVTLVAEAADPDGDSIEFEWRVSAGQIDGDGRKAQWTSNAIGRAEVTIFASDRIGGTSTSSISVAMLAPEDPSSAPPASSTPAADALAKALDLYRLGSFEEALQAFARAKFWDPRDPDAYYYIGEIYLRQGDVSGAIGELETARSRSCQSSSVATRSLRAINCRRRLPHCAITRRCRCGRIPTSRTTWIA